MCLQNLTGALGGRVAECRLLSDPSSPALNPGTVAMRATSVVSAAENPLQMSLQDYFACQILGRSVQGDVTTRPQVVDF